MKSKAKNLNDFRATFDPDVIVPAKIRTVLAQMLKDGADSWDYETAIVKQAGINSAQLAAYREQFAAHIVETRMLGNAHSRRVWFADPKVAAKVRT
jgi:hypothetical protein